MKKRVISFVLCLTMAVTLLGNGMPVYAADETEQPVIATEETINKTTEDDTPRATPSEAEPNAEPKEEPDAAPSENQIPAPPEPSEIEVREDEATVSTPSEAALQEVPQMTEAPDESSTTDAYEASIAFATDQDAFYGGEIFTIYNTISVSGNQTVLNEGAYTVISIPKDSFQKPTEADVFTEFDCFQDLEIRGTEDDYLIITTYKTVYGGYTGGTPIRLSLLPRQVVNGQSYQIRQMFYDKNDEPLTSESIVSVKAKANIESLSSRSYGDSRLTKVDKNYVIQAGTEITFDTSYFSISSHTSDPRDRRVYAEIPDGAKVKEGTGWTLDEENRKYYKDVPRDQWRGPSITLDLGGIDMSEFDSPQKCKDFRVNFTVQPVVNGVVQTDLGPYSGYCFKPYYIIKDGHEPDVSFSFVTSKYTKTIGPNYQVVAGGSTSISSRDTASISYNEELLNTQRIRYSHQNISGGSSSGSYGDEKTRELILKRSKIDVSAYTFPSEVRIVLMGLSADRIDGIKEKLAGTKVYGIAADGSRTLLMNDVPVVSYASYKDSFTADGWKNVQGGEAYKAIEFEYPNGGLVLHGQAEIDAVKYAIWTEVVADLKTDVYSDLRAKLDGHQTPQIDGKNHYATVDITAKYQKSYGDAEQSSFELSDQSYANNDFRMQYETIRRSNSITFTNGNQFFIGDAVRSELAYSHRRYGNFSEPTMPDNANLYYLVPDGLEPLPNEQFTSIEVIRGYRDGYNLVVAKPKTMILPELGTGSIELGVVNRYMLNFTATERLEIGKYTIYASLAIDNNKIGVGQDGQQYGILQSDTPSGVWQDILKDAKNRPDDNTKFTDLGYVKFQILPPRVFSAIEQVKLAGEEDGKYASSLGKKATIGDEIDYRWVLKNNSTKAIDTLTIINILPFCGDSSIVANDAGEYPSRGSCFQTPLRSVEDNEKFDIYYSTDVVKPTIQENKDATWSQTAEDMSKVTMIKAVLKPGQTIPAGESDSIITHNQIENNNQIQDGEKAYNSFAISVNEGNSFWETLRTEVQVTYPKRDVILEKTDAKDTTKKLYHAVFSLYEEGTDLLIAENITTNHDGLETLSNLLVGKTYYLLETEAPQGYVKSDEKIIFTVSEKKNDADVQKIEVRNTSEDEPIPNPPVEDTGNLMVTKTVSGSGSDQNQEFTFTVTLDKNDLSGQYGDMSFVNGSSTFTLKHGQSKTANGLPAGTAYTVEETDNSGYTVTKTNAEGIIQKDTTAIAAFENYKESSGGDTDEPDPEEEQFGTLMVTKTVSGSGGDQNKEFTFTVTLDKNDLSGQYGDMTFINGVATFTLKHGQSKAATRLPAGTAYAVEETDNSGYTVTKTNAEGIIQKDMTATAFFENYKGSSDGSGGGDSSDDHGSSHTPQAARVNLTATKTLDGLIPTGSDFTFFLDDANGQRLQVKNNQNGNITFDPLIFHKTGTYIYYLTEQTGSDQNINYDTASYRVTITVTCPYDYVASVAYEKNGQAYHSLPVFANTIKTNAIEPSTPETTPTPPSVTPSRPQDNVPKTGDSSNLALWGILAAVSLLSLIALLAGAKTRKASSKDKKHQS